MLSGVQRGRSGFDSRPRDVKRSKNYSGHHRLAWWHPRALAAVIRPPGEQAMIQLSALFVVLFYALYLVVRLG